MDDLEQRLTTIQLKQERAYAFIKGVVIVGALLGACIQWYAVQQYKKVEQLEKQVIELQRAVICPPDAHTHK